MVDSGENCDFYCEFCNDESCQYHCNTLCNFDFENCDNANCSITVTNPTESDLFDRSRPDYYAECEHGDEVGCCLVCDDSHEGCVCYDCKCKKCGWYVNDGYDSGHCGLVDFWRGTKAEWNEVRARMEDAIK